MKFINTILMVPLYLALVILLIGGGAVSLDKTVVTFGRFVGVIFSTVDQMSADDNAPLPADRRRE